MQAAQRPRHLSSTERQPAMAVREGSLEAPTRHPIDWKSPDYYD